MHIIEVTFQLWELFAFICIPWYIFNVPVTVGHSKITMAGDVVPYYTVTALVPSLK